jgi:hypothetical protein
MKHWQLFVLLVGFPIFFEFLMAAAMILTRDAETIAYYVPVLIVLMVVCMGSLFMWYYTLGTNLYKLLPATARMNLTVFKIFLFTPVIYIVGLCLSIAGMFLSGAFAAGSGPHPALFLLIFPLHLFSMFCIFYCMWFIAKSLKAAELQKPVTAGDYIGDFLLLWFYFVGVWFIQPRINRLFYPPAFDDFPESITS